MTDLPAAAITALEHAMLARYPKAHLHDPGIGFRWPTFIDVLRETWPHIAAAATAAERERIIALATQLRAAIPADHPPGAQASFADYLRVTTEGDTT